MKTLTIDYDKYKEELTRERMNMMLVFEPLVTAVSYWSKVVSGKETVEPPMTYEGVLKEIFKAADQVEKNWKNM